MLDVIIGNNLMDPEDMNFIIFRNVESKDAFSLQKIALKGKKECLLRECDEDGD